MVMSINSFSAIGLLIENLIIIMEEFAIVIKIKSLSAIIENFIITMFRMLLIITKTKY